MMTRKGIAALMLVALVTSTAALVDGQGTTPSGTVEAPPPKPAVAKPVPAKPTAAKSGEGVKSTEAAKIATGPRSIVGEVVDPACWIVNGARGETHKECAIACAKAGQVLAILEKKTQKLYLVATGKPGEDPNKGLIDYVAQTVLVKGRVYTRGGAAGIKVESVEPYTAPKAGAE